MALQSEPVSRSLDKKLQLFGYEVPDVLALFLLISILNFILGSIPYKALFVWIPAITLAVILRVGKRGKPDNYLIHLAKFYTKPKYYSAFEDAQKYSPPPKLRK